MKLPAFFTRQQQVIWYCLIAAFNAGLFITLNTLFLEASLPPAEASVMALVPVLGISYLGHKRKTFRSPGRHRDELPRFVFMAVIDLLLVAIVPGFAERARIPHLWVSVCLSALIPLVNFLLMRFWIFSLHRQDASR